MGERKQLHRGTEPPSDDPAAAEEPAGRVEFDSRGKAIWRWAREMLDSTSILLKRLENKDLALEPTQNVPVMRGAKSKNEGKHANAELSLAEPKARDSGGGFDPYNSR